MPINPNAVGMQIPAGTFRYDERDVMLYALGVGATPEDGLDFVYENNLKVLPTFAVVPAFAGLGGAVSALDLNPVMVLHGEQRIDLYRPIPTSGTLSTAGRITHVYDKGKGALVVLETETRDQRGEVLFINTVGIFARGEGGFGGDRGPGGPRNVPPDRAPDATVTMPTLPQQAAIYRLSGDRNPLHIDPDFAKLAGYDRPILHGLCTMGHVGRAVLRACAGNDPTRLLSLEVRFSGVVFPGDDIITELWRESDERIVLRARTQRGDVVISNAAADVAPAAEAAGGSPEAAIRRLTAALENRDINALMAALTPEAVTKAMTLQSQLAGAGQAGTLESYELTPSGTEGEDHVYDLALRGDGREVRIRTRWRLIEGAWKVRDLEIVGQ